MSCLGVVELYLCLLFAMARSAGQVCQLVCGNVFIIRWVISWERFYYKTYPFIKYDQSMPLASTCLLSPLSCCAPLIRRLISYLWPLLNRPTSSDSAVNTEPEHELYHGIYTARWMIRPSVRSIAFRQSSPHSIQLWELTVTSFSLGSVIVSFCWSALPQTMLAINQI